MPSKTSRAAAHLLHQTATQKQTPSEPLGLADVSPRHAVWDAHKAAADDVADVYRLAEDERIRKHAARVDACSQVLTLAEVMRLDTGEVGYKAESWKCRGRHCPVCQSARARCLHREFAAALPAIMEQVPGGAFLLLTLTVRNCPIGDLRRTLAGMGKAWRRLVRYDEFQIVRGWVRGTEVTRSEVGEAHPHFHALLLVPPGYFSKHYIKQARWVELWQQAAKLNYVPSVDIRRVKTEQSGLEEAIKAATYSVKPVELSCDPAWFHEFHKQVSSLRFLATGGVIKIALAKSGTAEDDDIAEGEDPAGEPGRRLVFGWNRPARRYWLRREK